MIQPVKILNSSQIREADAYTILNEPIDSIDLMERASQAFARGVSSRFSPATPVIIFCGIGNNGGDGLAVARILSEDQFMVTVYIVRSGGSESKDFSLNLARMEPPVMINDLDEGKPLPEIPAGTVIIDAIFGSGLTRPAVGWYGQVIGHINSSGCDILSIDIASGLFSDQPTEPSGEIINPTVTVSFQQPKLALFMPESDVNVGEWYTADIGLHREFLEQVETDYYQIEKSWIASLLQKRPRHAHKGTFGNALLLEGSLGKMGAAILSGRACLRSGVGLLTLHIPKCGYQVAQTALPEAMVSLDPGQDYLEGLPESLDPFQAIGIGPGIGTSEECIQMISGLFSLDSVPPLVLDADALNILSANTKLLESLPPNSILTPHPREFERLAGPAKNGFHRLEQQRNFAQKNRCYLVLKGAYTSTATPEGKVYFNSTGNPGMATAGSGDVLTGIITSFLSQGYGAFEASIVGVYVHGLAGDLARELKGEHGLIASDIVEFLPSAVLQLNPQG